jgi:hypothetical protein
LQSFAGAATLPGRYETRTSPAGRPGGDFNGDGATNVADLGILGPGLLR